MWFPRRGRSGLCPSVGNDRPASHRGMDLLGRLRMRLGNDVLCALSG
jgi:hypothetical protein